MSVVLDASVVLRLLLQTGGRAAELHDLVRADDLHAPALVDVEVASGLRRLTATGAVGADRAAEAVDDLVLLGIERYPHTSLLPRIWQLRSNLTACDATCAALAERLGCALLTADRGLATAPGPRCERRHLS
ncbi:Predicted nucleic acid-binding protein, contains PIN domain [Geodermatophilus dictyosporus]|uniref:Ribonuclease VapC n=1 Tax=Geodermatophilus dictyosporus TaxID=1523247 RepID=A0A1I5TUG8_9ACTN|nr:type II toxin-antitoxin system VapC family toxin [Geodermatophilus dictyosporus]SFP86689.1 Predicted nucleic acid-binding protein, contains PIN domain [Geodermatophilus dictyosporus]